MAIAVAVGPVTAASSGTTSTLSFNLTSVTAGHSIVVGVYWFKSGATPTISSITCTSESDLTVHGSPTINSNRTCQMASLANVTTGGTKTITITMSESIDNAARLCAFGMSVSGADTSNFFDTSGGSTGASTTASTSITTARDGNLLAAIACNLGGGTGTAGSGYTGGSIASTAGLQYYEYDADAGTAGSKTVDIGWSVSNNWVIAAASFNAIVTSPNITPGVGTLTATGYAPTVGGNRSASTGVGSASFTGYAPTVGTSMSPSITPGVGALTLGGHEPTVVGANSYSASNDLLVHTISAEGYGGPVANIDLLTHSLEAEGSSGAVATASNTLLMLELNAGGNEGASLTLLVHESTGTGVAGNVGTLEATLLDPTLSASGLLHNIGTASNDLLYHSSDASALIGNTGELEGTLAVHRLETVAYGGNVGTAAISLLLHTTSAAAFAAITGSASVTLAGHYLEAAGFATLAETYRAWALNLRTQALTEYNNFEFNSFAFFDGKYLAAGPGGIVELGTQDADGTDVIHWRVRTGSVDYGSTYMKRVPRLYVTGEFAGNVKFRTITSEDGERTYLLPDNAIRGDQQRRVPIGKGPKSLQWAFELEDVNGEDMRVSRILPYPAELGRRSA